MVAFIALFDLVFQVSILGLLLVSMIFERKKKLRLHGTMMAAAVVLNIASFAMAMGPMWDRIGGGSAGVMSLVAMGHAAAGGLAFLLSIFLAGFWFLSETFLQASTPKFMRCYSQKNPMRITLAIWVVALILGALLFFMANTSLLGTFSLLPSGN